MEYSAEHYFVSNLLAYPDKIDDVLEIVQPEDFRSTEISNVYRAMISLSKRNKPVSIPHIYEECKCDPMLMSQMLDILPEKHRIKDYAKLVCNSTATTATTARPANDTVKPPHRQQVRQQEFDASEAKDWILENPGIFTVSELDREFNIINRREKNKRSSLLKRMKQGGLIDHYGSGKGRWRTLNTELVKMDLDAATPVSVELPLPLGINKLCNLYPGSIVVIAGSPNAGKSAVAITLIKNIYNNYYGKKLFSEHIAEVISPKQKECTTRYFNSESSVEEMKSRLSNYDGGVELFKKAEFYERSSDFSEVISPNGINIIDYMEIYDNFWEIGSWINDVHKRLERGIAVIVIQKKKGQDMGRGGEMTLEKPRLYISLENNPPHGAICKIVKAKIFKDSKNNPNGKEIDFKLINGAEIIPTSEWRYVETDKDRTKINSSHQQQKIDKMDAREYVFEFMTVEGDTVNLNQRDFNKWSSNMKNIDVYDELIKINSGKPWLKKKTWYHQLPSYLAKLNSKAQ